MTAGHDLNYIAITGVLNALGRNGQPPTVPLNIIGDFAGGSLYLALGILAGILEARASGQGQVVDAAIVDGAASLATTLFGMRAAGMLSTERGDNVLDSGAFFYDVYECADGRHVSVGPIEDIPPLPDLAQLWEREPRSGDATHNEALARDLAGAEIQLSAYRAALHRRITGATDELIARYREDPALCLLALPANRHDAEQRRGLAARR